LRKGLVARGITDSLNLINNSCRLNNPSSKGLKSELMKCITVLLKNIQNRHFRNTLFFKSQPFWLALTKKELTQKLKKMADS
jgi:hypothetical protein